MKAAVDEVVGQQPQPRVVAEAERSAWRSRMRRLGPALERVWCAKASRTLAPVRCARRSSFAVDATSVVRVVALVHASPAPRLRRARAALTRRS